MNNLKDTCIKMRQDLDGLARLVNGIMTPQPMIIKLAESRDFSQEEVQQFKTGWEEIKNKGGDLIHDDNIQSITPIYKTHNYMAMANTSILLGKAWLGKVLGLLGTETPYQNDGERKDVKDIEETADTCYHNFTGWDEMNPVEQIDKIRQELKKIYDITVEASEGESTIQVVSAWEYAHQHIAEARFHLGFKLGEIKTLNDANKTESEGDTNPSGGISEKE